MSNEAFDSQTLVEKLSKLNNSQQSIESLSRWCITHRKRAKLIVETWDKLFVSSQKEQRVSFLYLSNDILQNSRRKGSEFVNEFWKVLPDALKRVYGTGDENGKKAATRLVTIWEERKVFGSRGQSLKDEMLGNNPPPLAISNGKTSSNPPIKIVKRDANSVRIKLAVGCLPEKILTAYQTVLDDNSEEEAASNKFNATLLHLNKIGEDVDSASTEGSQHGQSLLDEIQQEEQTLEQCIGHFESAEATRSALVCQLKEALQEQESMLEVVRSQLQVARNKVEQANSMWKKLASPTFTVPLTTTTISEKETTMVVEQSLSSAQLAITTPSPLPQHVISFAALKTTEEEKKKAAAAAVAAKLAASTSSAQMLSSVLSSLVAEEAASMNGSLHSGSFSGGPMFPPEKRQKLDKSMAGSDAGNPEMGNSTYFNLIQQQQMTNVSAVPTLPGMQSMSQGNQIQAAFNPAPPPLPPPSSANPSSSQYISSGGMMSGMVPYGYGQNPLPPPPPLPPHIAMGLSRPSGQPLQQPLSQAQQQQPTTGGFYRPPGIGFYGQNHQPNTPPVHRH